MRKQHVYIAVALLVVTGLLIAWYLQQLALPPQHLKPTASISTINSQEKKSTEPTAKSVVTTNSEKLVEESNRDFDEEESTWFWRQAIENSYRVNDLIFKAGMVYDNVEKETLFLEAYARDPDSLLLNYRILEFCLGSLDSTLCSLPIADTLLRIDGDNLNTLSRLAVFKYSLGDIDTALTYLVKANESQMVEDYGIRYLEAIDESYRYHGFERNTQTLTEYFGTVAATTEPSYAKIMSMCDAQTKMGNTRWKSSCSNLGKAMLERGKAVVEQQIGLTMQMKYSGLSEEEIEAYQAPIQKRFQENGQTLFELANRIDSLDKIKVSISDEAWQTTLKIYRQEGELAALFYLDQAIGEQQ